MSDAAATGVFEARLDAVRSAAADAGLQAVLATSDASIAYLTGFSSIQLERLFAVAVPVRGRPTIVVPHLESEAIADVPRSFERVVYPASSDGMADLVAALGEGAAVGVEEDHLVYGRALALSAAGKELRPAGRILMALREAKDAAEIERIRHAVDIVERVMARMFDELGEGDVEHAVNAKVSNLLREAGATDAHALVLFGANAANPHGKPGARQLRRGEVICADISAQIDGYWADLTRCGSAGSRASGRGPPGTSSWRRRPARSRSPAPVPRAATSTRRSARSSRPRPSSAPACTAPATRSASTCTSRRS